MTHELLSVMYQCQPCLLGDVTCDTWPWQYTLTLSALTCPASTPIPTCQYCIRHVTYYDAKLFECWPAVSDVGPAFKQHWVKVLCLLGNAPVINSRPNTAMLIKCWASVLGSVPALKQHWLLVIVQGLRVCLYGQSVPEAYTTTLSWNKDLSTIYDVGPTLSQLWFNVLSLLACRYTCMEPI